MKRGILFIMMTMFMVSSIEAKNIEPDLNKWDYAKYRNAKPIQFVEKGITFILYPNGKLKYKQKTKIRKDYRNRSTKRYVYQKPVKRLHIVKDRWGKVKRVGKVRLYYNRRGKVNRIGSVPIAYQHRKLLKVGGLHIKYRPNGKVIYYGKIKPRRNLVRHIY